ncbi:hypothetical protein [Limimaricola pyoseonensis]|uniref:Uncharacterized protein n=1 Tax=Limimaricola pyoseonensis TaxID=521013 RepID=A0A1G7ATI3_9RHOB|nr:hypothetical protein [Limimaricola pyoseonensis]SDE18194.1 hypothetical protein SAMN04488567_1107 [Limimaricola pyoseonensis]
MKDAIDPKGLVREAYRIEGIGPEECRSIFLDWALSLPEDTDSAMAIRRLLERHATAPQGHPMTAVLVEGLNGSAPPKRRGGRAGRQG